MIVVVDTREQAGYTFRRWKPYVVKDTLTTGDYSIMGYQDHIAIERKSLGDFYRSIGKERGRFYDDLDRLSRMRFKLLLIEARAAYLFEPRRHKWTKIHTNSVWGSLQAIQVDLGIPVFLAETRLLAEEAAYRFLMRSLKVATQPGKLLVTSLYRTPYVCCSICGKTRVDAIKERPDLGVRQWVRVAEHHNEKGQIVLGERLAVCYACRADIRTKAAVLPDGYSWVK